jgi:hypothetical protein
LEKASFLFFDREMRMFEEFLYPSHKYAAFSRTKTGGLTLFHPTELQTTTKKGGRMAALNH